MTWWIIRPPAPLPLARPAAGSEPGGSAATPQVCEAQAQGHPAGVQGSGPPHWCARLRLRATLQVCEAQATPQLPSMALPGLAGHGSLPPPFRALAPGFRAHQEELANSAPLKSHRAERLQGAAQSPTWPCGPAFCWGCLGPFVKCELVEHFIS